MKKFKVGDEVLSRTYGCGVVTTCRGLIRPYGVEVDFGKYWGVLSFTEDGQYSSVGANPLTDITHIADLRDTKGISATHIITHLVFAIVLVTMLVTIERQSMETKGLKAQLATERSAANYAYDQLAKDMAINYLLCKEGDSDAI